MNLFTIKCEIKTNCCGNRGWRKYWQAWELGQYCEKMGWADPWRKKKMSIKEELEWKYPTMTRGGYLILPAFRKIWILAYSNGSWNKQVLDAIHWNNWAMKIESKGWNSSAYRDQGDNKKRGTSQLGDKPGNYGDSGKLETAWPIQNWPKSSIFIMPCWTKRTHLWGICSLQMPFWPPESKAQGQSSLPSCILFRAMSTMPQGLQLPSNYQYPPSVLSPFLTCPLTLRIIFAISTWISQWTSQWYLELKQNWMNW